jgi:tryptophan halogenase
MLSAVGLASGFLEPLESTSIYFAQMAITYLIELFPAAERASIDPRDRDEFNRLVDMEYDRVRDFLILHYHATTRERLRVLGPCAHDGGARQPGRQAGAVAAPGQDREIFADGLFYDASWIAVYIGQGMLPDRHDPRAALADPTRVKAALDRLRQAIASDVSIMPDHRAFLTSEAARLASAA